MTAGIFHQICARRSAWESLLLLEGLLKHIKETSRDNIVSTGFLLVSRKVMLACHPGEKHVCEVKWQAFVLILLSPESWPGNVNNLGK